MSECNLSKLQIEELKIFREFISICEKNSLRYMVCGGTFLGAIRHKGFIPWDDDIDVAMPRPDFEKFLNIAPSLLSSELYLSTYSNRKDHITLVAQIFNKDKQFTLNNASKTVKTGAWIDILVIDGAPRPGLMRKIFAIKYLFYRMMSQFSHFSQIVNIHKKRPFYESLAIKFAQLTNIEKHLDAVLIGDRFHNFLRKRKFDESDYVATFMGAAKMNEILPREVYGNGTKYSFEGMIVYGPDKYDEYLKHFYGDYMKLPPENERSKHNVKEV